MSPSSRRVPARFTPWLGSVLLALACQSPEEYQQEADEEAYALIQERRRELFGQDKPFRVESPADSLRQRLLRGEAADMALSLLDCLTIAAENSREFQDQKETLYLSALDLTLAQWQFHTRWDARLGAGVSGSGGDAERAELDGGVGLERLFGTGATIVADLGASLFRLLSTGDGWDALSNIGLSVTQPLLRGAARTVVREPLTQAERDLVYAVRDYERFRRTLAVDVANRYFRVLQSMDQLANERNNAAELEALRERNEALTRSGRLSDIQVDQARQDELRSNNRLIELEQALQGDLDGLKLFLGLPIQTALELDPEEVGRYQIEGLALPAAVDDRPLTEFALAHRLDYLNTAEQVQDAERQVIIAADALRAGLDVTATLSGTSEEGRPLGYRSDGLPWSVGLDLDLPVDQVPERNAYRAGTIALAAARRGLERFSDQIQANLRDRLRQVRSAGEQYQLQLLAVSLAERRVQSANLNLQAGRSSTRDVLEAQSALLAARNAVTAARIDSILAWLELYSEVELLGVEERGIVLDDAALAGLLPRGS